jgi:hypothetical protein
LPVPTKAICIGNCERTSTHGHSVGWKLWRRKPSGVAHTTLLSSDRFVGDQQTFVVINSNFINYLLKEKILNPSHLQKAYFTAPTHKLTTKQVQNNFTKISYTHTHHILSLFKLDGRSLQTCGRVTTFRMIKFLKGSLFTSRF